MHMIRKALIAGALALASGVASAHYLPIGATPPSVSPGDVIAFGHAPAAPKARSICLATTPLYGLNEVERVYFGRRAPNWGNKLLESAAARAPISKVPPMGPMEMAWERGGIPPFAFTSFSVTTATVAQARWKAGRYLHMQRTVIRPLADLNPARCSRVILIATHSH